VSASEEEALMTEPTSATRLGAALIHHAGESLNENTASSYRAASTQANTAEQLGPLSDLPGFWEGTGFGLIARPDFDAENRDGIFLQLNILRETIEFRPIGSPVMNRGSKQPDIALYGVTYLHRVTDAATGGALHIESGAWLNIPATAAPASAASIARLSMIPHGNSVCAMGFPQYVAPDGSGLHEALDTPEIPPANTVPFDIGAKAPPAGTKNPYSAYDLSVASEYRTSPLPAEITQDLIDDPNVALRDAIKGQMLTHITRLITSTDMGGGLSNIPFITQNADAQSLESVWAIEQVNGPSGNDGNEFVQLQYSQTALLNFRGKSYPHVTVGTMIKAF